MSDITPSMTRSLLRLNAENEEQHAHIATLETKVKNMEQLLEKLEVTYGRHCPICFGPAWSFQDGKRKVTHGPDCDLAKMLGRPRLAK